MNLFLSLKTKPFVILSGISGTGKTKIVQWLAESVGASEEDGRFTLIPVRPDWNGGSDLLGYFKITAYRIKDIVIKLEGGQLVITRGTERKTLPIDALLKQPSMVFKEIVRLMDSDNT